MSSSKSTLDGLRIDRGAPIRKESPNRLLPIVVLLVIVIVGVVWWSQRSKALVVQTAVARVEQSGGGGARTLLNASGYVTARRAATVSSKVTGKVMDVLVEEGMKVEEGQELAHLDASNVTASLRLAEAQLESAQKSLEETKPNLAFTEKELQRFSELAKTRVVSDSDLRRSEMEARVQSARMVRQTAEILVAERQVAEWKQQLDDTVMRAPFSGVVISKNAQPGEMISPMSVGGFTRTGICTIVDMSSLEIEVDVNESYINRVQAKQPVEATLDAYGDWKIPAKVIAIIPTADRQKATVKVRVGFDQLDPRILPDMGVKVAFRSTGNETAAAPPAGRVIVPKSALLKVDERDVVWVVRDQKIERRAVTVAQTQGEESTIAAGLSGGEKVVLNPPAGLQDGARISEKIP